MDDEEKAMKALQEEYKDKIAYYEEAKTKVVKELEGKEGEEKYHIENRIQSYDRLIEDFRAKLNPTNKKEMYK
jgi:hypothetical protein